MGEKAKSISKIYLQYFIIVVITIIVIVEIYSHLFLPKDYAIWVPHGDLYIDNMPNIIRSDITSEYGVEYAINSQGNRGDLSENDNEQIVFVGDSYTFGEGVEINQTFVELIKKKTCFNAVNLGVNGYEPEQIYKRLMLKYSELNLSPDIIIYPFFYSDLEDIGSKDLLEYNFKDKKISPKKSNLPLFFDLRLFLARNSFIYNMGYKITTSAYLNTHNEEESQKKELKRLKLDILIFNLKEFSDSIDSEFLLVYFPNPKEIRNTNRTGIIEIKKDDKNELENTRSLNTLLEIAKVYNIKILDMTTVLENENVNKSVYYQINEHLNTWGHYIAAEEIYRFMEKEDMLDQFG